MTQLASLLSSGSRNGLTLSEIAAPHGTTVADLAAGNGILHPDRIDPGQRLTLRAAHPAQRSKRARASGSDGRTPE